MKQIYKLEIGGTTYKAATLYFNSHNSAVTRAAEAIYAMDQDVSCGCGYVHLFDYITGNHLIAWTKTSNERPTEYGFKTPEECI